MSKKRVAVSELMGTLIMVTITLIAGAAAFGWVNGQAQSSENAYGASAGQGINYLREHFAIVTSTFTWAGGALCGPAPIGCTIVNLWVFNNGQLAFSLKTLQVQSAPGNPNFLNVVYTTAGFTAYNTAGASLGCSPSTPGFSPNTPSTNSVAVGTLSTNPYSATIPTSCTIVGMVVGQGYVITMTGQFGNVVQYQVTANG